jgi:hypothetical protein
MYDSRHSFYPLLSINLRAIDQVKVYKSFSKLFAILLVPVSSILLGFDSGNNFVILIIDEYSVKKI